LRDRALRGRETWLQLGRETDIWVGEVGSLLMAHNTEAWQVLQEFQDNPPEDTYQTDLLTRDQVLQSYTAVNPENLHGGLFTHHELAVDPRQAISLLPSYLQEKYGIEFHFSTPVTAIDLPRVSAGGQEWRADYAIVCSGTEFELLYPELFRTGGFTRCKLQMLSTVPQPRPFDLNTMMVGTMTMQHYPTFAHCPTLPALKARLAQDYQHLIERGIHVMAVQNEGRQIILGDSHDYAWLPDPMGDERTDEMILEYLQSMLKLPSLKIAQRWLGIYSKHTSQTTAIESPAENVRVACMGGLGMTLSFGTAQDVLAELLG